MGYPSSATVEQKILAALARIESKLDDTERRVKAVQQDVNRVKPGQKNSTGLGNFKPLWSEETLRRSPEASNVIEASDFVSRAAAGSCLCEACAEYPARIL
jgi:hypothetical protein